LNQPPSAAMSASVCFGPQAHPTPTPSPLSGPLIGHIFCLFSASPAPDDIRRAMSLCQTPHLIIMERDVH
jgi:hypothetical protein